HPKKYADLLGEKIERHNVRVYLVNTGWSGGPYGVGQRMNLKYTRAMVSAAVDGSIENTEFVQDPIFGLAIPKEVQGVPSEVLVPRNTWKNPEEYDKAANELKSLFVKNFEKFKDVCT